MSYILDALNKSEKEKRRQKAPDLGVVHRETSPGRRTNSVVVMICVLVGLVAVGGGAYWLGTSRTENAPAVMSGPNTTFPRQAEPASLAAPARQETSPTTGTFISSAPPTQVAPEPAITGQAGTQPDETVEADRQEGELITPQDFFARQNQVAAPKEEKDVVRIAELPPNIQRQIPDLTFSSHIYSDEPSFRMVNINGRSLREGDMIAEGIKLVEISEEGVIVSYLHYTFEVSVLRDWSFN